jgi:hypothetical protein
MTGRAPQGGWEAKFLMGTFGQAFDMQEMPINQWVARAGAWSHRQPRRTDNLVISVTFLGFENAKGCGLGVAGKEEAHEHHQAAAHQPNGNGSETG